MKDTKIVNIGKIIKSDSHINYKCRVYGNRESNEEVGEKDYKFGQFVKMKLSNNYTIIGVIYNSQLYNPDYGNFGPRLSNPASDNRIFMPDYIEETAVILDILLVGWLEDDKTNQNIPPWVVPLNTEVTTISYNELIGFHKNDNGGPLLAYYNQILINTGSISYNLLFCIINQLELLVDKQYLNKLELLKQHLVWQQTTLATKV